MGHQLWPLHFLGGLALGSSGLMKGLRVTCYPSFMESLSSIATTVVSKVQYDVDGGATDVNSWMCTLQYFVLFFFGLPGCSNII